MVDNAPMVQAYVANAARIGRTVQDPRAIGKAVVGSTDMGNVSYLVPSIHPMIQVAEAGVPIHTPDFAEWARSESGDRAVLDGAKIMAMTIVDDRRPVGVGVPPRGGRRRIRDPPDVRRGPVAPAGFSACSFSARSRNRSHTF
jgi:hypothetical protein